MTRRSVAPPGLPNLTLVAIAVMIGATIVVYANSLQVPFLFDDGVAIAKNASLRAIGSAWFPPVDGSPVTGRPLLNVSFAINRAFGGSSVWGYHALNLTIHITATLALFGLARRTMLAPRSPDRIRSHALPLALTLAMLWALHPLQTGAVTYISQRAESLAGCFSLLALYAFVRSTSSSRHIPWTAFACLFCLAGVATKETAATVPLLAFLWDRTFGAGSFRAAWREHGRRHLALMVSWIPLGALVLHGGGRGETAGPDA